MTTRQDARRVAAPPVRQISTGMAPVALAPQEAVLMDPVVRTQVSPHVRVLRIVTGMLIQRRHTVTIKAVAHHLVPRGNTGMARVA